MSSEPQVIWHQHAVSRRERERIKNQRGCVVWFTGLSGCGKSTIANEVDHLLHALDAHTYLLDGDNVRHGLNAGPGMLAEKHGEPFAQRFGLGFGPQDREENIRRVGAVAQLFCDAGLIVLTAFVSPYRRDRDSVREVVEKHGQQEQGRAGQSGTGQSGAGQSGAGERRGRDFIEVFVDAPLEICEQRDPKGLYKKARAGQIKDFTGIDAPYEPPLKPELTLDSANHSPVVLAEQVVEYLRQQGVINIPHPRATDG